MIDVIEIESARWTEIDVDRLCPGYGMTAEAFRRQLVAQGNLPPSVRARRVDHKDGPAMAWSIRANIMFDGINREWSGSPFAVWGGVCLIGDNEERTLRCLYDHASRCYISVRAHAMAGEWGAIGVEVSL